MNITKCLNCDIEMMCINDVNDIGYRADVFKCPKCKAVKEVVYHDSKCSSIDKAIFRCYQYGS